MCYYYKKKIGLGSFNDTLTISPIEFKKEILYSELGNFLMFFFFAIIEHFMHKTPFSLFGRLAVIVL